MLVGIDMGGTHIDGVILKDGRIIRKIKNPVVREDIFNTIWTSLKELVEGLDKSKISRINLSTTVSTNAIVENKISKVGLIVQPGPGVNYDFSYLTDDVNYISGYVDHRGKLIEDIDMGELENIKLALRESKIENLGVVTKFSTRNPTLENEIKDYFDKNNFKYISLGHRLSGKLNFPRRVNTSYLNSAVYDIFKNFAENISKATREENISGDIFILKADGGTMRLEESIDKPVETILSGPSASFMGMSALLESKKDSILLDIGGTTTDIFFLVDGIPVFEPLGIEIDEYKTLVRAIYSSSIGLGGDSFIDIVDGKISIGPERKDKPMVFDGKYPTPTDAMVVLNKFEGKYQEKSIEGIKNLAGKLNMGEKEFAEKVLNLMAEKIYLEVNKLLEKLNSKPLYTVREVLEDRKIVPEEIKIIGGPADILADYIEKRFNLQVSYPKDYEVANAIGAALAKTTMEINLLADTDRKILSVAEIGLYEKINSEFNLNDGRERVFEILQEEGRKLGEEVDYEIVEENSFNMVDGFTRGRNIRIKGQIRPGLIYNLRGEDNES